MNKIAEVLSSDSELLETLSVIRFSRLLAMKSSIVGWCNFHKHIVWAGSNVIKSVENRWNSTRSSSFQLKTRPNKSHRNTVHLPMKRGTASAPPDPARASPIVLLPCPLDLGDRNCPNTVRVPFQPQIKYMLKLYLTECVYYTYIYINIYTINSALYS